ncbi:MAG: acyl-CoA thioesterase domain-containing protein, partial [Erythrobacter sp.]
MTVADLLAPLDGRTGLICLPTAHDWMQGRTLYGGASTLLAYTAAIRAFPDLPPLRAGQVAFVAPVGETVEFRIELVRQGRNVAQVRSEILCEGRVALSTFWLFGIAREANALHPPAALDPLPELPAETLASDKGPSFIRNHLELRRAQAERETAAADHRTASIAGEEVRLIDYELTVLQAALDQAEARVEAQKVVLEQHTIRSP